MTRKWFLYHYTTLPENNQLGWKLINTGSLQDMRTLKGEHPRMVITSRKIIKP